MKKFILSVVSYMSLSVLIPVYASTLDVIKIITGDRGGVVTVNKHAYTKKNEKHLVKGLVTISDIRVDITADNITDQDPLVDEEILISVDMNTEIRVSGRVRFKGVRFVEEPQTITLNGAFHSLFSADVLQLQGIAAVRTVDGIGLSGTVVLNDVEYEINAAPENIQRLVRRLLLWIQHQ